MAQMNYPLLSEYERAIKKDGTLIQNLDEKYAFIPSRTAPIKFFNFGSGAFAAVFKIENKHHQKFALRCFLSGGNPSRIERVKEIISYLSNLNEPFLCKTRLFERGLYVNSHHFPAIIMDWSTGTPLNKYVSTILQDNYKITQLQEKIVELSHRLENLGIAHGDIQSGNVLVELTGGSPSVKLVDYDAMFIPVLRGKAAIETGHSSFQHNNRTKSNYDDKIDRFPFWLILTALEALKFDKNLWNADMQGGFNDGDNFLFKAKDIAHPHSSALVARLKNIRQTSLDFYLNQLLSSTFSPNRDSVKMFGGKDFFPTFNEESNTISVASATSEVLDLTKNLEDLKGNNFAIDSNPSGLRVFIGEKSPQTKVGLTPIKLSIPKFASKKIIILGNKEEREFYLNRSQDFYYINFDQISDEKQQKKYGVSINGKLEFLTISEIEGHYKTGFKTDFVEVDGKTVATASVPELKELIDRYQTKPNEANKPLYQIYSENGLKAVSIYDIEDIYKSGRDLKIIIVNGKQEFVENVSEINNIRKSYFKIASENAGETPITPTTSTPEKDNTIAWVLGITVGLVLLGILFASGVFDNKKETVETVNYSDSTAVYYADNNASTAENTITIERPIEINPFDTKYAPYEKASLLTEKYLSGYTLENDNNAGWDSYTRDFITNKRVENGKDFPYIVRGDFDGDKKFDIAFIARNSAGRYLFIFLTKDAGTYHKIELGEEGIAYAAPNLYKSFAGDGGTDEEVYVTNDAIFVEYFEASASVWYYINGDFKSLLLSD